MRTPEFNEEPRPALSLTALRRFEDAEPWRHEWDRLVASTGANVYMTYDWCRIWWRFYGKQRELRVLAFRHGPELVAIIPAFVEDLWIGPARVRVCKPCGSDFSIQLCNPPIHPDWVLQVMDLAREYLAAECKVDVISLSPLSGGADGCKELYAACQQMSGQVASVTQRQIDCHSTFSLPPQFDDYLKSLGKSQRTNYRRDSNLLAKSYTVSTDVLQNRSAVASEFRMFRDLHTTQWNAEGRRGHFDDWPDAYPFNVALAEAQAELGRTRIYRLLVNGSPVSYQYGFAFERSFFWRLPARTVGAEWHRYGLGRMGLAKLIESAINEGLTSIEGGQGHYDYKVQLGAIEHPVYALSLLTGRPGVKTRFLLAQILSASINLAYYKILFRRVYPRMPALSRPLSPLWIRTRL